LSNQNNYINREAHDKTKGFRLQKLRALELMVESEKLPDNSVMFWAIEKHEDIFQMNDGDITLEENKSYSESSSFTFNSVEVKKALISFIDLWIHYEYSEKLVLNFYSTNKIGKENASNAITIEDIKLPKGKMLELAQESDLSKDFIEAAKKFISHWIKETYSEKSKQFIAVTSWKPTNWKTFFKLITWKFEQPNEVELNNTILEKIKACKWFSSSIDNGREEYIKARLMDELDSRQSKTDFFNRVISKAEVELIFIKAKSGNQIKKDDALWKMWNSIEVPNDKRNVVEKLKSRWSDINDKDILVFSKKAVQGGIERESYSGEKDFMSLRYRVFDFCENKLIEILESNPSIENLYSPESFIDEVFNFAKFEIEKLQEVFQYSYKTDSLIYNIIFELIDNCYLAFDDE